MPFIPVPNVLGVEMRYLLDNQQAENTLYFQYPAAPTITDAEDLADYLFTWWDTDMKPLQTSLASFKEVYITDLTDISSFSHTRVTSPVVPGTRGGNAMPNNVALCISFRTAKRGRAHRGRNYVFAMAEDDVSNNNFTTTYLSGVQAAYISMNSGLGALGTDWVVVSRFFAGSPRPAGAATPVTSVGFFDGVVDSQRRRLPGRGS